jgi:hypothetical protein
MFIKLLRSQDAGDVNTGGESSSQSAGAASQAQTDVNQVRTDSSSGSGVKDTQKAAQPSLADVIAGIRAKHTDKEKAATTNSPVVDNSAEASADANSPVLNENETLNPDGTAKTITEDKVDANAATQQQPAVKDEELPFGKHPRFQELIKTKNELTTKVQTLEPVAQRMQAVEDFCAKSNVSAKDFDEAVELAALVKQNPVEAIKRLEQVLSVLKVTTGQGLPQDLQQQVDDGLMPAETAKQLAQTRVENARLQSEVKQNQTSASARVQQQLVSSLDNWTTSRQKTDPGFKPKQEGQPDGKFELIVNNFQAMWNATPPATPEAAVQLAEKAYNMVHSFMNQIAPKPVVKRPLSPKDGAEKKTPPVIDTSKPGWAKKVAMQAIQARGG